MSLGGSGFFNPFRLPKVILEIRMQRVVADNLIAILLSIPTLLLQKSLSNDLVDPYVLGSLSGAFLFISLGALLMGLAALEQLPSLALGFTGSLLVGGFVAFASLKGGTSKALIMGLAISIALQGLSSLLAYLVASRFNRPFLPMLLGTTEYVDNQTLTGLTILSVLVFLASIALAQEATAMSFGEDFARSLGVRPEVALAKDVILASVGAGAVTGCCGIIPFLGLISANLGKRLSPLEPYSEIVITYFISSIIMMLSDALSNFVETPYGSLPVGAILSTLGGLSLAIIVVKSELL